MPKHQYSYPILGDEQRQLCRFERHIMLYMLTTITQDCIPGSDRTLQRLAQQKGEERVLELSQQRALAAAVRLSEGLLQ